MKEETWKKIGNEAISLAVKVDCTPAEYRSGLREIIELLQIEIAASIEGGVMEEVERARAVDFEGRLLRAVSSWGPCMPGEPQATIRSEIASIKAPLEQRVNALVLSYETKVEDLARETLRSSELARLLSEARDVLVTDGHDGLHRRHCARCQLAEEARVALGLPFPETP